MRKTLSLRRLVIVSAFVGSAMGIAAQQPATGVFTSAQATAGKAVYDQRCAECHGNDLGGGTGPALAGAGFVNAWGSRTTRDLLTRIKTTMPPGAAGSLEDPAVTDIVAHILQTNGRPAGPRELRADSTVSIASGAAMAAGPANAAGADGGAGLPPGREVPLPETWQQVQNYTPVTDALLKNPPAGEWLSWRRTQDGQGYSPLREITVDNVHDLKLAWAWGLRDGANQVTPLVHDGVMFLASPGNLIQALDARAGTIIWEYRHPSEDGRVASRAARTIALYHDKIFVTTPGSSLFALDARSGKLVWETRKADPGLGYSQSAGPMVAGGVVVSGIGSCGRARKDGCFITGHDPDTGRELWRTQTIAQPGDPNNASWGRVPLERRAGTESWIPGSYDAALNLFYIGTAQAKPWMAFSRGMSTFDAALYSNATLALDPKTGKIVWHFQHIPGESLDLDTVFERVLVDVGDERALFTIGKDGLMWKLDRRNGKFLGVKETVFQNIYQAIDHKTGRVQYRTDIVEAQPDEWIPSCPSYWGGHNWIASAYSPESRALIVPLHQSCFEMKGQKADIAAGNGADVRFFEMPETDGSLGKLTAYDVRTLQPIWNHQQRAMLSTGALTTAGGLVFVGDADRWFKAFDAKTGKVLWQTRLGTGAQGYPITYTAGGKQYIAVPSGMGPFLQATRLLTPEIYAPTTGNALYVFELAERR